MNSMGKYGIGALAIGCIVLIDQIINKKRIKYYPKYITKIEDILGKSLSEHDKDIIVDRISSIADSTKNSWARKVYKRMIRCEFSRVILLDKIYFYYGTESDPFISIVL